MKVISLMQPWASLIAVGAKKIETRSWATNYRGELAIHASKKWGPDLEALLSYWEFQTGLSPLKGIPLDLKKETWSGVKKEDLPFGSIVAVCKLVDCVKAEDFTVKQLEFERLFGDFAIGRFGWILNEVRPLEKPIPAKGRLGLWNYDFEVSI